MAPSLPASNIFRQQLAQYLTWAYDPTDIATMTRTDANAFQAGAEAAIKGYDIPAMVINEHGLDDSSNWWARQGWIVIREGRLASWTAYFSIQPS